MSKIGFWENPDFSIHSVGYAFIVENPSDDIAILDSEYEVSFYTDNDTILGTELGRITLLLPGQRSGIAGGASLPPGASVHTMNVQIVSGHTREASVNPSFIAKDVEYVVDDYVFPKVTGIVVNPYPSNIQFLEVTAILYDGAGEIVGGESGYVDLVPAQGQAAFEVNLLTIMDVNPFHRLSGTMVVEAFPAIGWITKVE